MNFIKVETYTGPTAYVNVDLIQVVHPSRNGKACCLWVMGEADEPLEVQHTSDEVMDLIREANTITTHVPTEVDLPQPEGVLDVAEGI